MSTAGRVRAQHALGEDSAIYLERARANIALANNTAVEPVRRRLFAVAERWLQCAARAEAMERSDAPLCEVIGNG